MFSRFLEENSFRVEYYRDLCNYIEKMVNSGRPLVAVHGMCTDGGTSGAIIHHQLPEAVIIPLDYKILNHPQAKKILEDIKWHGIVDLKPFNQHEMDFWVDHHLSAMNSNVNAKRIRFDADGDSGAYQLFLSKFLGEIPYHLLELAIMTRTTDTANYLTEPPIKEYKTLSEIKIITTEGIEGQKEMEKRIWLLDDAWGSITTLKEQLQMYTLLAKDGFFGLETVLPRINKMRQGRRESIEYADNMDIDADIIVYSYLADTRDNFTITRRLQTRGVKVVISMAIVPDGIKMSLRRNRQLSDKENKIIQLNELASKMNGGGHAGASGAKMLDIESALEQIKLWADELQLSMKYTNLEN